MLRVKDVTFLIAVSPWFYLGVVKLLPRYLAAACNIVFWKMDPQKIGQNLGFLKFRCDHFLPIPDVACSTFTVPWWMLSTYPHSASEIELTLSFIFCLWSEIRYRGEEVGSKKSKLNHLIICISIYQLCIVIKRVLEF